MNLRFKKQNWYIIEILKEFSIECFDLSLGETPTIEQECEFKDDIIEILLHDTASILSGNIESLNQYNIQKTNVNERM